VANTCGVQNQNVWTICVFHKCSFVFSHLKFNERGVCPCPVGSHSFLSAAPGHPALRTATSVFRFRPTGVCHAYGVYQRRWPHPPFAGIAASVVTNWKRVTSKKQLT